MLERRILNPYVANSLFAEIQAVVSSNDRKTRYINMERMAIEKTMSFPFAVNVSFNNARSIDDYLLKSFVSALHCHHKRNCCVSSATLPRRLL